MKKEKNYYSSLIMKRIGATISKEWLKTMTLLCIPLCVHSIANAQEVFSLSDCINYSIENNHNLKKAQYEREKATYAHKEVTGALLPQINASSGLNYNAKKAKFIMPNFVNMMLPPSAQDPSAPKFMTIEMGMKYNANVGVSLNQQILNLPLFNTLKITEMAEQMAALGLESNEEDLMAQVAHLFYGIQSTEYAAHEMLKSAKLVEKMLQMMEVSYENGLVRKVDVDRLKVTLVNLTTQASAIRNAVETQKNLLKLQMGLDMREPLNIAPIDLNLIEQQASSEGTIPFDVMSQTGYKLLLSKRDMAKLQKKSVLYEYFPSISLTANYQYSGVSEEFFRGETNYWYPTSVIGLSLRLPIFSGLSRRAKAKESNYELLKAEQDVTMIEQSLSMAYRNAQSKLEETKKTINLQKDNQRMAEEVFKVTENNFALGVSSMSDVLNANQSLIQAQMSYADALNEYMSAYIDLIKASGRIREILTNK